MGLEAAVQEGSRCSRHGASKLDWQEGETFHPKNTIPIAKHDRGIIMLWGCFAANGFGALNKVNGIMEKEDYL